MTSLVRVETKTSVGLPGLGPFPTASPVSIGALVPLEIGRNDVLDPKAMMEFSKEAGFGLADGEIHRRSRHEGVALCPLPADPDDQVADHSSSGGVTGRGVREHGKVLSSIVMSPVNTPRTLRNRPVRVERPKVTSAGSRSHDWVNRAGEAGERLEPGAAAVNVRGLGRNGDWADCTDRAEGELPRSTTRSVGQ
jgi:hypothetical protein